MNDFLEGLRKSVMWLSGAGASMVGLAVAAAAGWTGSWLAIVPVVIGGAMTLVHNQMRHRIAEYKLRNEFHDEISAVLAQAQGYPPAEITVEHLHMVARGSPERGIREGNAALKEAMERNDADWRNRTYADVIATLGTLALLSVGALAGIAEPLAAAAVSLSGGFLGKVPLVFTAAATKFLAFHGIRLLEERASGFGQPCLVDRIREIKDTLEKGETVTSQQVLGVFLHHDKDRAKFIASMYGTPFETLPESERANIARAFDETFQLRALTDALNRKQISPNELAFTVEGKLSGAPVRAPGGYASDPGFLDRAVQAIRHGVQKILPGHEPGAPVPAPAFAEEAETLPAPESWSPQEKPAVSFAERYALSRQPAASAVERLALATSDPGLYRIH